MFVLGDLINAVALILYMILHLAMWLIIIRALISWVSPDPYNPIVQFLMRATEPILTPLRRLIPPISGLDLSPLVAIFAIYFLQAFLVAKLHDVALRLGQAAASIAHKAMGTRSGTVSPVSAGRGGAVIACKVAPSSSKTEIVEVGPEEVRLRVAAPPVDGKANKELIRYFSKLLSVPKSSVQILKGESGRHKKILVSGADRESVEKKLMKGNE